jgi:phage I-like protein
MAAVPYQRHPVIDGAWDADAAVARMRKWAGVDSDDPPASAWHKYAEGFAKVTGEGNKLGDFHYPHHDVRDGKLVTSKAGVAAAIAAMHGARSGQTETEGLEHLEKHRAEWADKPTTTRCPGIAILLAEPAPLSTSWNQIARHGTWKGHEQGEFSFNDAIYDEIIRNHNATKNRRVPLDQEHLSETLGSDDVASKGVPAMAWVKDIVKRGDELWALFEWKDQGAVDNVRAGRTAYLSPAVNFNSIDRESGEPIGARLTSVALTNHPFIDGMAPVTASEPAASVLAALSPESVHVPTSVGKPKEKTMAEVTQDGQDNKVMAEKHKAFMSRLKKMMAADGEANEGMEDEDVFEDLSKRLAEHREMKAAHAKRMAEEADGAMDDDERSIPKSKKAREYARALFMSDRAGFEETFPKVKRAQPVRLSAAEQTLMTGNVSRMSDRMAAPSEEAASDDRDLSAQAHERAVKLMSDASFKAPANATRHEAYIAALGQASREVRGEAEAKLMAAMRSVVKGGA